MNKLLVIVFIFFVSPAQSQDVQKYSSQDLDSWQKVGVGNGFVTHGQFYMEEMEGSKGFMILSPEKYKDVIVRYEVMTLNPATVLVAMLNASDIGNSNDIILKENSDSFGFWTRETENYMFGFRVMAHNSTPFVRKHPAAQGEKGIIGLAEKDVMYPGWRHLVECGRKGNQVWLKIDGETLIDVTDKKPPEAGRIILRVRGTAGDLGKCMIRNLEITGESVR